MAKRGHDLVFGAGANGLMGAVARGVKRGGGKIQGVIPKFFEEKNIEEIYYDCDELIFTDSMRERKAIMEDRADAFIVVPGGIGTYEELYEILTLKQLGCLDKTIVIFNYNGYYNDMLSAMNRSISKGFIADKCRSLYKQATEFEEAVFYAEELPENNYSVNELKKG